MADSELTIAYYCSGHGFGHATRVSAFATSLLSLNCIINIYIVSSAPKYVFADSVAAGAHYRCKDIDPVIVQPMAYRVDRLKSVRALECFLEGIEIKVDREVEWLEHIRADCVLSDSAFLGCLAAKSAGIPSALVTNFTFDSVFSYLETLFVDEAPELLHPDVTERSISHSIIPVDIPIPAGQLSYLVDQIHAGFRAADLLCLLPGSIPIPSFTTEPKLPSTDWVDLKTCTFRPDIISHLEQDPKTWSLHPSIPITSSPRSPPKRRVIPFPLLVRPPNASIYTPSARSQLLSSVGVPLHQHETARVLVVSFGGQIFHTPKSHSHTTSRSTTPARSPRHTPNSSLGRLEDFAIPPTNGTNPKSSIAIPERNNHHKDLFDPADLTAALKLSGPPTASNGAMKASPLSPRIATDFHLWVPGAPPAAKIDLLNVSPFPTFTTTPPTPLPDTHTQDPLENWSFPRFLPDEGWIAIVCGASKDEGEQEDLPDGFYIAPKDVYMPDLTAVADVLLGKLGYGGVSECLDACTPFVYVPRPLFIEEHGLRLLLDREGTGIELSRASYEAGDWADAIQSAYENGRQAKSRRRLLGDDESRRLQVKAVAQKVVDWANDWKQNIRTNSISESK